MGLRFDVAAYLAWLFYKPPIPDRIADDYVGFSLMGMLVPVDFYVFTFLFLSYVFGGCIPSCNPMWRVKSGAVIRALTFCATRGQTINACHPLMK